MKNEDVSDSVKDYYSKVLNSSKDLKTTACCSTESVPKAYKEIISEIHPEISDKFYGCGSPFPPALKARTVLDLGCGTGRDVYILSKLVGEEGHVVGVDMTDQQLEVANKYQAYHQEKFGFTQSNVTFKKAYIEDLKTAGIEDNSIDLVVSNCVINLSPSKEQVFSEIYRVLKPGGELYFSDVFSDRRIPKELLSDQTLVGECLAGAMYIEDFRRTLLEIGIADYRILNSSSIGISSSEVADKIGMINFTSKTVRAFKIPLEDRCEDFGQVAIYNGKINDHPHSFTLDDHHTFYTNKPMLVCGNTADMLAQSYYGQFFTIQGDKSQHFGLFECGDTDNQKATCC